jgi:hypothetical protein
MMPAIIAAEGTAFALLAGLDGSVTWQAARVLMGDRLGRLVHLPGRARRPGATAFALGIAGTAADAGAASAQLAPTRMWRSAPRMGTRLTASARPPAAGPGYKLQAHFLHGRAAVYDHFAALVVSGRPQLYNPFLIALVGDRHDDLDGVADHDWSYEFQILA